MESGEQGGASAASFPGSTTTAFAALTTILLATGSALYVRAKCTTSPLPNSTGMGVESTSATQVEAREHGEERNIQYSATHSDSRDSKTPRTKERRRRRKDPVKEIMKGSKKGNKLLLKLSQAAGDTSVPSSAASDIEFADDLTATSSPPGRSRDASVAKSRTSEVGDEREWTLRGRGIGREVAGPVDEAAVLTLTSATLGDLEVAAAGGIEELGAGDGMPLYDVVLGSKLSPAPIPLANGSMI